MGNSGLPAARRSIVGRLGLRGGPRSCQDSVGSRENTGVWSGCEASEKGLEWDFRIYSSDTIDDFCICLLFIMGEVDCCYLSWAKWITMRFRNLEENIWKGGVRQLCLLLDSKRTHHDLGTKSKDIF